MSGENSPLFLHSSPSPRLTRSPDDEVPVLVQRAQAVESLIPAFEKFLVSYNHAFFDVFDRQVDLIRSRSQAFEDGHVTVFDKTLLALTHNGKELNNPAAITYYCKEYLNLDIQTRDAALGLTPKLQQTVQVSDALRQELSSVKTSMDQGEAGKKRDRLLPVDPNLRKDMEPRLAVLWSVYETAREEYLAVIDKDDNEQSVKRAKFLRDTAENILLYLQNRNADPLMIAELEGTFKHAKDTAVCLSGGKKRKFDPSEMDQVKGTPRGPSLPYRKDKYRGSGGGDAGTYKHHHHQHYHHPPDISSGYTDEMTSSYGWGPSDLPGGHRHPYCVRYTDTYTYQDRDSYYPEPGAAAAAAARDRAHGRSHDKGDEEHRHISASGLYYNTVVSSGRQGRRLSASRTRDASDERVSSLGSDDQDNPDRRERGEVSPSLSSTPRRSASPKRDTRRRDRMTRDQSHRRRSRSPAHDRAYDRAYSRDRRYEGGGRSKMPSFGRAQHGSHPHSFGMLDSYVPSRDRSRGRSRGRRGS